MDTKLILIILILLFFTFFFIYSRLKGRKTFSSVKSLNNFEVLEITISKNADDTKKDIQFSALAAENMFSSIHGLLREDKGEQEHFSFEITSSGKDGIKFFAVVPTNVLKFVEGQIYAQYPNAAIRVVEDYTRAIDPIRDNYEVTTLKFTRPGFFPIKTFRDFEADPLSAFTSSLSHVKEDENVWFQLIVRPIPDTWQPAGFAYVKATREGTGTSGPKLRETIVSTATSEAAGLLGRVATGLFVNPTGETYKPQVKSSSGPQLVRLSPIQELEVQSIENKLSKVGYEVVIRIMASSGTKDRIDGNTRSLIAALRQYTTTSSNNFKPEIIGSDMNAYDAFVQRKFDEGSALILNGEELATLFHLPSSKIDTPNIVWSYSRKSEPPVNLPTNDCVYIADTLFRSKEVRFGIANNDDRLRHMYVVGKSGVGKSTLFEVMVAQDINNGAGVCMIDPHGETIDRVLERIPDNRIDDVVYFDPSDTERPIGLNLLEVKDTSQGGRNLAASGLLAAIKHHFDYSWGPRLEYLLNYALLTLTEIPGTTMLSVTRLLEDKNYRSYIVHQVDDHVIKRFWETEYKELAGNQRFITEAVSPIQNKVNRFLSSTTIRNILGQAKSTLDLEDAMNNGKILLINLSKGKIGADNANLLGALIVSRLQYFALKRASMRPEDRKPFYLYADEFQNVATGSFKEILSESRKYGLGLYLTHQYTAQLSEDLLKAILGNVGTIINFASGAEDARIMANEFAPFEADDIVNLERFHVYMKLMIDGMTSLPFSARILTPWLNPEIVPPKTNNKEKVIAMSREKYGVDREFVETKINKWLEVQFDKGLAISQEIRKNTPVGSVGSTGPVNLGSSANPVMGKDSEQKIANSGRI